MHACEHHLCYKVYARLSSGGSCLKCLNNVTEYEYDPLPTTFMCTYIHHMHTCIFSMDLIGSTFLNTDPANSGDLNTGDSSVMDSTSSSQPPARTTTAEMSPKATPSSHPSSSTIASPPVTEEVGSGPPVAVIGGAVGAVVVLTIIGVVFLIVGVVCVVQRKKHKGNKPVLYDMPPDAYCTFGE